MSRYLGKSFPKVEFTTPKYDFSNAVKASNRGVVVRANGGGNGGGGGNPALPGPAQTTGYNAYSFSTPPPAAVNDGMGNYFEALRVSEDRSQIPYAMIHLRPQILRLLNGLNRKLLSAIGRYLVDNGGTAGYVINQIADYTVPVIPRSQTSDPEIRKIYDEYFKMWTRRADYTRRYDYYEMQRLMCTAIDVEGDIGMIITDEFGFPQLRLYDTFHIGTLTGLDPKDGVDIDDNNGIVKGYRVVDGPVDTTEGAALKFIPLDQFYLLYDVERFCNYRGYSGMRRGSNDLRDKVDLKAFIKLKEKVGAALAAVIQQNGPIEEDVWGDDSGPQGNQPIADPGNKFPTPQEKKLSLAELLGGDIPVIEGELKQFVAQALSSTSIELLDVLDSQFCLGMGIPPAFFLDEKLTGPNVRSVMGKAQRKFNARKRTMAKQVEWTWFRVIAWGIAHDGLPAAPDWQKISYQFAPISTIDLGDSMANERADVLCGQMSETERYGNKGKDFEHEHSKIKEEISVKLKDAIAVAKQESAGDDSMFKTILPAVMARFGLVGVPTTTMAIQEAGDEQDKNAAKGNDSGGSKKKEPAKEEKE